MDVLLATADERRLECRLPALSNGDGMQATRAMLSCAAGEYSEKVLII